MALFDIVRKRPEIPAAPAPPAQPSETPTDKVIAMQNSGLSNNQIIQELQRQGYSQTQVYDALNLAAAKKAITQKGGIIMQEIKQQPTANDSGSTEEIVESIIEEKWKEFEEKTAKEKLWKETVEARLVKVEQMTSDLRNDIDALHGAIVGKIGEYDKNLLSVGTEIKAMEKVFQKILPTLSDNVSELSKITQSMKSKK